MQQTQESEQHYILYCEAAECTEQYNTGKLKRVSRQNQAYSKDSNTGSRRPYQLKACGDHSRQGYFGDDDSNSDNWRPEERRFQT